MQGAIAATQDISIRAANLADKEQLAQLCEALWPEINAEHHAAHLARMLDRPYVLKFPLTFIVAETADRTRRDANHGRGLSIDCAK